MSCTFEVLIGGQSVFASATVVDDNTITATTPPGTGTVDVVVMLFGNFGIETLTLPGAFTYDGAATTTTDSQKLVLLEKAGTTFSAVASSEAITSSVTGAIDDAFSAGAPAVTGGSNGFAINFAAEPENRTRTGDALDAMAYAAHTKAPPLAPISQHEWSGWADVKGTGFDTNNGTNQNGHQINATAGIGRFLTPNLLLGLFGGYESLDFKMPSIAGRMTGDGGTGGGYAALRFSTHWRADAMVGWAGLSYNATAGLAAGVFNGTRFLTSGDFTGSYGLGAFILQPSTRVYAFWERDSGWIDSLGALQASRDFSVGRVSTGTKIVYPWQFGMGSLVSPYFGFYADNRFTSDKTAIADIANTGIKNGWSGRATAGVTTNLRSGLAISVGGELGGFGAGYEIWSLNTRASLKF